MKEKSEYMDMKLNMSFSVCLTSNNYLAMTNAEFYIRKTHCIKILCVFSFHPCTLLFTTLFIHVLYYLLHFLNIYSANNFK